MTTREKLTQFLTVNGWKPFNTIPPIWPELRHEGWSKKPFGNVQLILDYTTITIHGNIAEFVSISIKLVQNDVWYNLQAYSISPEEFMEKHIEIEDKLTALRSRLCL